MKIEGLTQVGPQAGSNKGGTFEDSAGTRYYVKIARTADHARNEILASKFYALCGVRAASFMALADNNITASPMIAGAVADLSNHLSEDDYLNEIRAGFAVDAWLANWDVAGLVFDNIVTGADGHAYRVDPGGALLYRAQGAPKGAAFGASVGEWETLRNGTSYQSSALFAGMSEQDLKDSADFVLSLSDEVIASTVGSVGFSEETAAHLTSTLIARREDIRARV